MSTQNTPAAPDDRDFHHVRVERMRPGQIRQALASCPVVYIPLGTYEYHQEHLPVGLDALTAQGLCLRSAAALGGVVCPTFFYGTGGDHGEMDFTVMMSSRDEIEPLLWRTLQMWARNGAKRAVLFSGHFAPEQIQMVKDLASRWNALEGSTMEVLGLSMNMGENIPMKPDHAGLFETTLLSALCPETVDLTKLPALDPKVDVDEGQSPYGKQRLNPEHPLYAIIGADPRPFQRSMERPLLEAMLNWFNSRVALTSPNRLPT